MNMKMTQVEIRFPQSENGEQGKLVRLKSCEP